MAGAVSLLGRAQELLPRATPEHVDLLPKLAEARRLHRASSSRGLELFDEANAAAAELATQRLLARARLTSSSTRLWNRMSVPPEEVLDEVERAVPVLERAGDYEGLAIAEMVRFNALDRARLPIRRRGCRSRSSTPARRARAISSITSPAGSRSCCRAAPFLSSRRLRW